MGGGKSPADGLGFDTAHRVLTRASHRSDILVVASGLSLMVVSHSTQAPRDHPAPMNIPSSSFPCSENRFLPHPDTTFLIIFTTHSPHQSLPPPSPLVFCPCPSPSTWRRFFTRPGSQAALVAQRQVSITARCWPQAPRVTRPLPGVTVPSLICGPGTGEGRARELFGVQAVRADLRVILNGRRRKNNE